MKGRKIYWQKQGLDQLCAVHCISSLLQGPLFDEVALANIALELDKKQKQLMYEQGATNQFLKYMAEDSGNVAMDGNYSIQVLQQALKTLNLTMRSIQTIDTNTDLTTYEGFICNSVAHWFAMRKIDGVWYNLNSTNKRLPQIISQFYLSAFLIGVRQYGYQIFAVMGKYPATSEEQFQHYNDNQNWYPPERILSYHKKCIKRKNFKSNIGGSTDDKALQKALALSLGKKYDQKPSSGEDSDWDKPEHLKKKKIKEFSGEAKSIGEEVNANYQKFYMDLDDVEMVNFLKESLQSHFAKEPSQGILVYFRFSSGKKVGRMFNSQSMIEQLYDWIWLGQKPGSRFYLVDAGSKNKLSDVTIPLMSISDEDNQVTIYVNGV